MPKGRGKGQGARKGNSWIDRCSGRFGNKSRAGGGDAVNRNQGSTTRGAGSQPGQSQGQGKNSGQGRGRGRGGR